MQAVDERLRAFEPTRALHIGMTDDRADIVEGQLTRPIFHLGIPEAVKGKARFPGLDTLAAQDVIVRGFGTAQRPYAQLAIFQHLRMTQPDRLSGRPLDLQSQPADDILAEIEDGAAGGRCGDGNRRDRFNTPYRRPHWCDEGCKVPVNDADSTPITIIKVGLRPAVLLQSCIVGFAVVDVAGEDWSFDRPP